MSLITPAVYREHDPGTSLGDDAIQRLIDSNEAYMIRILGPHSRVGSPVVETFLGRARTRLLRQRAGAVVQVRERASVGDAWTTLDPGDFLALDGGQTLARLASGPNSSHAWAVQTEVTYVPTDNLAERVVALLDMVGADASQGVTSGGITSRTMGSWSESYGSGEASAQAAKDRILAKIHPRAGIVLA
jgi:hypothetical protein